MPLRGAISGFGEVAAQAHLVGWRSRPGVSIVAIHDPVAERRHRAINLIPNIRVYDDLELMLEGEALDFVDIASPPAFHAASARLALEAGANVLVEKPLCLEPAELDELSRLATSKSRVLMCVHNWRHAPAYRRAYELITQARLGEVRYIALTRLRTEPAGAGGSAAPSGERWRLDATTGGGILIDHGWHAFYLAQWLMGGDAPHAVSAHLGFRTGTTVDDLADLRIDFPRDRIAHVHLSWCAPARRTSAIIYGSNGILEIEGDRVILTERSGRVEDHSVADAPDDSYHWAWFARTAAEFERATAEAPEARENLSQARVAIGLIARARESSRTGGSALGFD
ncbi:MAG TPA: Gfo/Idh/MocA family oxidoreductase [Candidatus Binataceae bacterium]|nr:Gfo/Idh/MocA family oxidoreductase [Candidatus Binataceae bacterium]